jgi:thiamine pyrophosphate-dependent acetolactate synthase large subunit-like protein
MKVYQRLAQAFKAEGVSHVFGIMGDGNIYWIHELAKLGVKTLEVRHEGAGLGMADGWARVTRTPAVATTTCGPGVTQLATALVTASRAETPLVAFCGEHPLGDDEYNQRLDQPRFAAACETGFVRVATPDSVDSAVRKAFYTARLESRPVMLSAPIDVQRKEFEDDDDPYQPSSTLLSREIVQPAPDALAQAARIISESRRPMIVVGRGAIWSDAGDAVRSLAARIGALISTSLMAKTWLSEDEFHLGISGAYASRSAMQLCEEADCVVAVGASMNRFTTEHGYLYPNARYVHVDSKPHVMMSGGRAAECYVHSDARAGVQAIDALLAQRGFSQRGFRVPEVKERLLLALEDRAEFPIEPGTVDPRQVCIEIDKALPGEISVFIGNGSQACFSNMLFTRRRPLVLPGYFFGCIGQMLPAAIGAVLATGNKPGILIDGDASFMMHLAEFETAVRYRIPLLVVVMNNQGLGMEYYHLDAHEMDAELSTVGTPDLGAVAVACGGKGRLARSLEDVRAAVAEWVARPGPMILDVRISRSVVPLFNRRVHYGRDE